MTLLLDSGADVRARAGNGVTALIYAAGKGHLEVSTLLLDKGADVNARDSDHGFTPLTWAGVGGHADLVEVLLERGADPTIKSNEDKTVLRLAAEKGLKEVVEVLKGFGVKK